MEGVDVGKALNDLARHQMVRRIYLDILVDLTVCDIEGWDKMEYIHQLKEVIDHFTREERAENDGSGKAHPEADGADVWEV
jgi:5'(3')-deoxyribonucleotidase